MRGHCRGHCDEVRTPIGILSYSDESRLFASLARRHSTRRRRTRFSEAAIELMNDRLWGTLAAAITVPDAWQKRDPTSLEAAIARLRYGTIGINLWPGVAYALMSPPWGAFPGSTLSDVQSGLGFVHNTYLLGNPQKTVLRAPLSFSPKPLWFSTHRRPEIVAAKLCRFVQPAFDLENSRPRGPGAARLTQCRCSRGCAGATPSNMHVTRAPDQLRAFTNHSSRFAVSRGRFACRSLGPTARRLSCRRRSRTSFPGTSADHRGRWRTDRGCTG